MQTMTVLELRQAMEAQGVPINHVLFRCPVCHTLQSAEDLIEAGAGTNFDDVEQYLGFACIGRFTGIGAHTLARPIGHGCDFTLGGLLNLRELDVQTEDGQRHPRFMPATPAEAKAHRKVMSRV